MGTGRSVTKYYRTNYRTQKTTQELGRDNEAMILLLIIAGPFTFGATWVGLIILAITEAF